MMNFFSNLFGANGDPMSGFGNMEQMLSQQYSPWAQTGLNANNFLYNQWMQNATNPDQLQNSIAKDFSMSPYQNNLLNTTTQRMDANAANTGMLGSPSSQNYLQSQLNNMTGQFQNDYVNRGLGIYNNGMQGMNALAGRGLDALNQETGLEEQSAIANMKAQQQDNMFWPNLLGTGLGLGAAAYGMGMFGGGSPSIGDGSYGQGMGVYAPGMNPGYG
jgi:hypothetical protein